jgi:hypothetical protein
MVGFKMPRGLSIYSKVHGSDLQVQVLSNATLLKWVPTRVTREFQQGKTKLKPPDLMSIPACVDPKP